MKKVLYIFACVVLSAIILLLSFSSISYNVFQDDIKNAISEKNYSRVEQYANCVIKTDEVNYVGDLDCGMHVEVLPVLTATTKYSQAEDGTVGDGSTVYANAILFIMFNTPEGFTTSDETCLGGVTVKLNNTEEKFYAFNNAVATDPNSANYGVNFYNSLSAFNFLYVYVLSDSLADNETDLLALSIESFKITDEATFDTGFVTLTSPASFNNSIYANFNAAITEYNDAVLNSNDTAKSEATDKINSKVEELQADPAYLFQLNQYSPLNTPSFWVPMILIAVGLIGVSVGLGFVFFRKRKFYKKQPTYVQPQQQFSRADIMGSAYAIESQNDAKEETVTEVKEEVITEEDKKDNE